MCGIAGILALNGSIADEGTVGAMTDCLEHRGPDGRGTWAEGPIALGHRRLSIIDIAGGAQPMSSASQRSVIVYNGEIYNAPQLREHLSRAGQTFRTRSDTEVILAAFEAWGIEATERLSGMFAFALWDRATSTLHLVRDRIGIKPLYWSRDADRVLFASEIKALRLAHAGGGLDARALNLYFSRQYVPGRHTFFDGIERVAPGERIAIHGGEIERSVWWRLPSLRAPADKDPRSVSTATGQNGPPSAPSGHASPVTGSHATPASLESAADELAARLRASVERHLLSDVTVGLFLSGGLDSSVLLSFGAEQARGMPTFTVGFGSASSDDPTDETAAARSLARRFGCDHHEVRVRPSQALQELPRIVRALDQPLADYAILPTYVMSRFAREHVKVVLSGEGGDELFAGYPRYRRYARADRLAHLAPFPVERPGRIRPPNLFRDRARRVLLGDAFIAQSDLDAVRQLADLKRDNMGRGHLNSILRTDMCGWLVDDLLLKVDSMSMLASLEARVPYLDPDVIDFVLPLDGTFKLKGHQHKRILREIARTRLPPESLERPKRGLTVPVNRWFRGQLASELQSRLLDGAGEPWIRPNVAIRMLSEHQTGRRRHGHRLWAVLLFVMWLDANGTA